MIDDHRVCSRDRSYIVPLTGNLLQRYNAMDRPLCEDLVFFQSYRVKILSLPFASDTDTQRFLGYSDQIINVLKIIQVRVTNSYNVSLRLYDLYLTVFT